MSRGGICDSRCQSFYTDMIKKEESVRIRWFLKNQQKLLDRLKDARTAKKVERLPTHDLEKKQSSVEIIRLQPLPNWRPREPDGTININIMKPIDPQVRSILYEDEPSFITADNYIRESTDSEYWNVAAVETRSLCEIVPKMCASIEVLATNKILSVCKIPTTLECNERGFHAMIEVATIGVPPIKELPENRHYYPDCTSWIHGWRLTDYPPVPRSKVGRKNLVISEFYHPSMSSLQRDPEWYRPAQSFASPCNEDIM